MRLHFSPSRRRQRQTPHQRTNDVQSAAAPTRDEINAKLETIDARIDGRMRRGEDSMSFMIESIREMRTALRNVQMTIIVTAIGATLTILLGLAAFNATLVSNMVASFSSGRGMASSLAEIAAKIQTTNNQQERIESALRQMQAAE
mgnify:FL=1